MMQFVRTFLIMRARRKTYCYKQALKLRKNCTGYIKNSFENGWWEDAYSPSSSTYPLDPPLAICYKNHQNSLAYFSHLAPLILLFFTIYTRQIESKGGEAWPNAPPLLNSKYISSNAAYTFNASHL